MVSASVSRRVELSLWRNHSFGMFRAVDFASVYS